MSDTERQGSAALSPSDLAAPLSDAALDGVAARAEAATACRAAELHALRTDPEAFFTAVLTRVRDIVDAYPPVSGTNPDGPERSSAVLARDILDELDAAEGARRDALAEVRRLLADLARARDAVTRVREECEDGLTETEVIYEHHTGNDGPTLARRILAALDADAAAGGEQA